MFKNFTASHYVKSYILGILYSACFYYLACHSVNGALDKTSMKFYLIILIAVINLVCYPTASYVLLWFKSMKDSVYEDVKVLKFDTSIIWESGAYRSEKFRRLQENGIGGLINPMIWVLWALPSFLAYIFAIPLFLIGAIRIYFLKKDA